MGAEHPALSVGIPFVSNFMVFEWYSNLSKHLDLVMHQFSMSPDIWENTWRHTPRATSLQMLLF